MTDIISTTPNTTTADALLVTIPAKLVWPAIATLAAAFAAIAMAAFTVGTKIEKAESSVKLIELSGALQQAQSKLVSLQEKNVALADANLKFIQANGQLNQTLSIKAEEVNQLASRVNAVSNCAFIHEQIKGLELELHAGVTHLVVWANPPEQETRDRESREAANRVALEQKIARYQAQLGPGACK